MKRSFFFLFAACILVFTAYRESSATQSQTPQSTRFKVSTVAKATKKLDTRSYHAVVTDSLSLFYQNESDWQQRIWQDSTLSDAEKEAQLARTDYPLSTKIEAASKGHGDLVPTDGANAIATAMVLAYADHRPLVLSPDMVWLLLLQGFSAHIEANPEGMRHHFVDFEGSKQMRLKRNWVKGDPNNPWEDAFEEFGEKIAENTKGNLAETCLPRFSTTGQMEKAAFEVTLMRAMDHYFDYGMELSCGIPEITLEGSPEDWALLETRAAALARYELDWWITPLQPILHEFTKAVRGQVDTTFWQDMVKKREYSIVCTSKPYLTGWMLRFFPYVNNKRNPWLVQPDSIQRFEAAFAANEVAEAKRRKEKSSDPMHWFNPKIVKPEQFGLPALNLSSLPNSMGKANVLLIDKDGTEYDLEFLAGCIGIRQEANTLALRPEFGWRILDKGIHGQQTTLVKK